MSRQAVLTHLKDVADATLAGFTPAVTVYDYAPSNLLTSPAVTFFASGTVLKQDASPVLVHHVYMRISVLYRNAEGSDERDAQVAINDLSDLLIPMLSNNRITDYWSDLNIEYKTDVSPIKMLSAPFLSELYLLLVTVL